MQCHDNFHLLANKLCYYLLILPAVASISVVCLCILHSDYLHFLYKMPSSNSGMEIKDFLEEVQHAARWQFTVSIMKYFPASLHEACLICINDTGKTYV